MRLSSEDASRRTAYLRTLPDGPIECIIRPKRRQRSSSQNRYYFGVVVALIAEACGYEPDEMHEVLAMRFLRIEDCPLTGAPRRQRTPRTNTAEFSTYVEQCRRFGAELGLYIPSPGEVE